MLPLRARTESQAGTGEKWWNRNGSGLSPAHDFFRYPSQLAIWVIAALTIVAIIVRPFRWPEAVWAVTGAVALVAFRLLPLTAAWDGVLKGLDVYLFPAGMMALAEVARQEGLFDWLAFLALRHAKGSPRRLFTLIYGVGIAVTTFLSNDATAVVLTPAVYAAAKAANAEPLPYLFICAFIANAASFVLPISNPANLVVYAGHMPALGAWLARFGLASLLSIAATFWLLQWTQSKALCAPIANSEGPAALSTGGKIAALGICAAALALTGASAFDWRLGGPAFIAGLLTVTAVLIVKREGPWTTLKDISWSVLPLVAGLFVLVEGLERSGLLVLLVQQLKQVAATSDVSAGWSGRSHTGGGFEHREQSARGIARWRSRTRRRASRQNCRRHPHRRRSRPEFVGDRFARDNPMAYRDPPRR